MEKQIAFCEDCYEEPGIHWVEADQDTKFWTGRAGWWVCLTCKNKRENYEPPDDEAWSGGFAENH